MSLPRVRYHTLEIGDADIHLRTLRDNQQFYDPLGEAEALGISSATWPLFGIVWPSSEVLASLMSTFAIDGLKILEVGCGIALASLVLNERCADITATDYHPCAGDYLAQNVALNGGREIPYFQTGWDDRQTGADSFDLIIGSDLLYEEAHAALLSAFIEQHANRVCEVIIIDPGRGQSARFSRKMIALGYEVDRQAALQPESLLLPYKGQVLHYRRH